MGDSPDDGDAPMTELRWWADGRIIHAQQGETPSGDDPVVGIMDTAEYAARAVEGHNSRLTAEDIRYR